MSTAQAVGRPTTARDLAARCGAALHGDGNVAVRGIAYDSRQVEHGDLFVALPGARLDGATFVREALQRGAAAVAAAGQPPAGIAAPWLQVGDPRLFLAQAARAVYRTAPIPLLVGITGTKGKSTTAHALAHVLSGSGLPAGLLGTVVYCLGSRELAASRTTPEAPDVERFLQEMTGAGLRFCAMEVSSHAIVQSRVAELPFAMAIFTNLGRDHLDFHPDLEAYFAAKRRLFESLPTDGCAVVNADDARAGALQRAARGRRTVTFGLASDADVRITDVRESLAGVAFTLVAQGQVHPVRSRLLGAVNASNLAAAFTAAVHLGADPAAAARHLETFPGVAGRMQPVDAGQPFLCLVDYAHTPEALDASLAAARKLAALAGGRVIVVMGCGGDRDRGKRPLMGMAAAAGADHCIVTSDNPRTEDPLAILLDVEVGIQRLEPPRPYVLIEDRREAIRTAVARATHGDVVLIAGKGHEKTQTSRHGSVPFDDREVAREEILALATQKGGTP